MPEEGGGAPEGVGGVSGGWLGSSFAAARGVISSIGLLEPGRNPVVVRGCWEKHRGGDSRTVFSVTLWYYCTLLTVLTVILVVFCCLFVRRQFNFSIVVSAVFCIDRQLG